VDIEAARIAIREFARRRDWDQFHHPKNLSMALAAEAGELLEVFQWLSDTESRAAHADPDLVGRAADEMADILIYLIRLADVLGVELWSAMQDKIERNAVRYPVDEARGSAMKRP